MSAQKSRAELSVWNFVDRKVKTLSGNCSCSRLEFPRRPEVSVTVPGSAARWGSTNERQKRWVNDVWKLMFRPSFSVRPKFYTPLLLLDRLPDCLGQQVVSVSRYGKRSAIFRPRSHHHIIIITVFPSIKLEHVLHETAQCACFVRSLCITFLSCLGLKLGPWTYGWHLIAAPFTMEEIIHILWECIVYFSWVDITNTGNETIHELNYMENPLVALMPESNIILKYAGVTFDCGHRNEPNQAYDHRPF